jgi:hypothetical protein
MGVLPDSSDPDKSNPVVNSWLGQAFIDAPHNLYSTHEVAVPRERYR